MSDIVERLRRAVGEDPFHAHVGFELAMEAIAEIERLRHDLANAKMLAGVAGAKRADDDLCR